MKCPKCGYNSFEFLTSCKKCSADLGSFKESIGIRSLVLPFRDPSITLPLATQEELVSTSDDATEHDSIFDWDTPTDPASATVPSEPFHQSLPQDMGSTNQFNETDVDPFSFEEQTEDNSTVVSDKIIPDNFGEFSFEENSPLPESIDNQLSSDEFFAEEELPKLYSTGSSSGELNLPDLNSFQEQFGEDSTLNEGDNITDIGSEFQLDDFVLQEDRDKIEETQKITERSSETEGFFKDEFDSLFGELNDETEKTRK